jgi:hypothetical protein
MAKYILVSKSSQPFNIAALPKQQVTQLMQAWGEWVGSMGSAVIDAGDAFNATRKRITADGVTDGDDHHTAGYIIIEARNFDEALSIAKSSPIISRGGSIEVYEAFAVADS